MQSDFSLRAVFAANTLRRHDYDDRPRRRLLNAGEDRVLQSDRAPMELSLLEYNDLAMFSISLIIIICDSTVLTFAVKRKSDNMTKFS